MRFLTFVLASALVACGGASPYTRDGGIARLTTRAVEWNPTHADVGRVSAVADRGTDVVVFADGAATVLDAGAVSLVDRSVKKWSGAATLPAADGGVAWIVGIDDRGRVRRLHARQGFEDVSGRWGLESSRVTGAAPFGDRGAVFLLEREIAVADGGKVVRLGGVPITGLSAGGGVGAGLANGDVLRIDAAARATRKYALSDAIATAVDDAGRVYAATSDAVYAENEHGELVLRFRATMGSIHGLAASKGRVWFAEGPELGAIENGRVLATTGAKLPPNGRLWPSTSGDVWIVDGGVLTRIASGEATPLGAHGPSSIEEVWRAEIQPVFARACAACHLPGGAAGVDLSTAQAWEKHKGDVRERVVETRDMPPKGHELSEGDLRVIREWVGR